MELNERLRTVKNAFISGSFSLFSADDNETICGLFVHTMHLRQRVRSHLMFGNTVDPCTVSIGLDLSLLGANH